MSKREWWIKANGKQENKDIDISLPGEDRWIETTVQSIDPGTNSVALRNAYLHVVEYSELLAYKAEIKRLKHQLVDEIQYAHRLAAEENSRLKLALEKCKEQRDGYRNNYWSIGICKIDNQEQIEIMKDNDEELKAILKGESNG